MKANEIKGGYILSEDEIKDIYFLMVVYDISTLVRKWVKATYKGVRVISKRSCNKIAMTVYKLIESGAYTDIEYAIEDVYEDQTPLDAADDEIVFPSYFIRREGEMIEITEKDMRNISDTMLCVKLADKLKEASNHDSSVNRYMRRNYIIKNALSLLRNGEFTDIDAALEEAYFVFIEGFNYDKHPVLQWYDDFMSVANDNYAAKIGRSENDIWDEYGNCLIPEKPLASYMAAAQ